MIPRPTLTARKARLISSVLATDAAETILDRIARHDGPTAPPTAYGDAARTLVDHYATDRATQRRADAYAARDVTLTALPDDMARLTAVLRADDALRAYDQICARAATHGDPRDTGLTGHANHRADALLELLDNPGTGSTRPHDTVYVVHESTLTGIDRAQRSATAEKGAPRPPAPDAPAATPGGNRALLTEADEASRAASFTELPADLRGIGPVSAILARTVASRADTTIRHLHVDHEGRQLTPPPPSSPRARAANDALADCVRLRDRHCRFPGCRVPASRCDIEHRTRWADGGLTVPANLWCLCSTHHHGVKHAQGTTCTGDTNHEVTIRTRDGTYRSRPPCINPRLLWGAP